MPIEIRKTDANTYVAEASRPESNVGVHIGPAPAAVIIEQLRDAGCHTTDIADAFAAADPDWMDDVTLRKRSTKE
jgi:hypothetical protein